MYLRLWMESSPMQSYLQHQSVNHAVNLWHLWALQVSIIFRGVYAGMCKNCCYLCRGLGRCSSVGMWWCRKSKITVMWDDAPSHCWSINATNHPEHAKPAEVFPPLLTRQKFREIGKHDGERASNTEEKKEHMGKMRVFFIAFLMREGHTHRWAAQKWDLEEKCKSLFGWTGLRHQRWTRSFSCSKSWISCTVCTNPE